MLPQPVTCNLVSVTYFSLVCMLFEWFNLELAYLGAPLLYLMIRFSFVSLICIIRIFDKRLCFTYRRKNSIKLMASNEFPDLNDNKANSSRLKAIEKSDVALDPFATLKSRFLTFKRQHFL